MMGGLVQPVKDRLSREQYYRTFLSRVTNEWTKVFDTTTLDVNLTYAYPSIGFPEPGRDDFPNC